MVNLAANLNELAQAELIRSLHEPDATFLFRHALLQDTAYASLLKQDRTVLHREIADALVKLHPDQLDEYAARLAQHYAAAQDDNKTLEYSTRAGDASARVYANSEALMHFKTAIETALRINAPGDKLVYLYTRYGRTLELGNRFREAFETYEAMESAGRERHDSALLLAGLMARAKLLATFTPLQDSSRAEKLASQALDLARASGDRPAQAKAMWTLEIASGYGGDPSESIKWGEQSAALSRELGLREQLAFALNDLIYPYYSAAPLEQALKTFEQAAALWRELGNLPMLTDSLAAGVLLYFAAGNFQAAIESGFESYHIGQSISNDWAQAYSRQYAIPILVEMGDNQKAMECALVCLQKAQEAHFVASQIIPHADLGWIYANCGQLDRAVQEAESAVRIAEQDAPFFGQWVSPTLARIHVLRGDYAAADAVIENGPSSFRHQIGAHRMPHVASAMLIVEAELAVARQNYPRVLELLDKHAAFISSRHVRFHIADSLLLRALAYAGLGDQTDAGETLTQALAQARTVGSRQAEWRILAAQNDLAERSGDTSAARQTRHRARAVLDYIAEHTPVDLRAGFLSRADVRRMFDA